MAVSNSKTEMTSEVDYDIALAIWYGWRDFMMESFDRKFYDQQTKNYQLNYELGRMTALTSIKADFVLDFPKPHPAITPYIPEDILIVLYHCFHIDHNYPANIERP